MSRSSTRRRPLTAFAVGATLPLLLLFVAAVPASAAPRRGASLEGIALPALGFGYAVTSQGAFEPSATASSSDPAITAGARALSSPRRSSSTAYERAWQDAGGTNHVRDLLVRCPSLSSARAFLNAVRRSIDTGETVGSAPLPTVPGARRTTYLASTAQGGVGQAVTMRAGRYVVVLSFVSLASGNPRPITAAAAERVARAQYAAMAAAPGGRDPAPPASGKSWSGVVWAVLAVIVLAGAVATPMLLRRRVVPANDAKKALK